MSNDNRNEQKNRFKLTLAALAGVLGTATMGSDIITASIDSDSLAQMASIAVPGMLSWVLSYLIYKKSLKNLPAPSVVNTAAVSYIEEAAPISYPLELTESIADEKPLSELGVFNYEQKQ